MRAERVQRICSVRLPSLPVTATQFMRRAGTFRNAIEAPGGKLFGANHTRNLGRRHRHCERAIAFTNFSDALLVFRHPSRGARSGVALLSPSHISYPHRVYVK